MFTFTPTNVHTIYVGASAISPALEPTKRGLAARESTIAKSLSSERCSIAADADRRDAEFAIT